MKSVIEKFKKVLFLLILNETKDFPKFFHKSSLKNVLVIMLLYIKNRVLTKKVHVFLP